MRFIHAADIHLDTSFSSRSDTVRSRLRDASRVAFERMVDLALVERVDAVLLAGDLFDDGRLSFQTERFLLEQLHRLEQVEIPVVYATGNHDPGLKGARGGGGGSGRAGLSWPENVTVAGSSEPVRLIIENSAGEAVGIVTATGHETAAETADLSKNFPTPEGRLPEVAVLHTQVMGSLGASEHALYAPSDLEELRGAGYDYWALGHVHKRSCLCEQPGIHYPGNTQGRTHGERGAKGCLLVTLSSGAPAEVEFKELAPIRWEDLEVHNPTDAATLDGLVRTVAARWDEVADGVGVTGWIARISISGATPLWRELGRENDQEHLRDELAHRLGLLHVALRIGGVHPEIEVGEHAEREDVLGQALRLVAALRAGDAALPELPIEQLIGLDNQDRLAEYVRGLLHEGEEEILSRMLKTVVDQR